MEVVLCIWLSGSIKTHIIHNLMTCIQVWSALTFFFGKRIHILIFMWPILGELPTRTTIMTRWRWGPYYPMNIDNLDIIFEQNHWNPCESKIWILSKSKGSLHLHWVKDVKICPTLHVGMQVSTHWCFWVSYFSLFFLTKYLYIMSF